MRKLNFTDWLLLLAGVLVLTLALGLVLTADAQTAPIGALDLTTPRCVVTDADGFARIEPCPAIYREDSPGSQLPAPDSCYVWPQPAGCPWLPWYQLSLLIPRDQQDRIVREMLPAVLGQFGLTPSPVPPSARGRTCYEANDLQVVEIPCAAAAPERPRGRPRRPRR